MPFPYQPQVNPSLYGLHVPYNQGYDAWAYRKTRTADQLGASGYFLRPNGAQIHVWITDLTADFSVSGQVGQSRMLREFFPRSFNDVTLKITGNTASTYDFNRLAAFVREHHWEALNYVNGGSTSVDQTITFQLNNNTPSSWNPASRTSDVISLEPGEVRSGATANVKGSHRPWQVSGYIQSMAAGAVAHEIAPQFQIGFIVATSALTANTGIWSDIAAPATSLSTILQMVNAEHHTQVAGGGVYIAEPKPASSSTSATKTTPGASSSNASTWSTQVVNSINGTVSSVLGAITP